MATSNVLKLTFATTDANVQFGLSIKYAKTTLKETGGLATIQTAAEALITQQPFDNITLTLLAGAEFVETTNTAITA